MAALIRIMNHELRIMVFVFSMILASLFLIHPVYAQTTPLPPTVSPVSPLYTDLLVHNIFHSFSCLAVGQSVIGQPCLTYLKGVPVLSQVDTSGGALGATTNIIGMLYQNPPVRTADYIASISGGFGVIRDANAQVVGSGAQVLNPILRLWQVSRNISYVLLIIIFLVIGLMVMFRNKLNPQTVITAQTALPGLVIGLIMITFSFFFAGLISDMAFVGTNIVGYYFTAAQGKLNVPAGDPDAQAWKDQLNLTKQISTEGMLSIFSQFSGIVTQDKAQGALASIYNKLNEEVRSRIDWLAGFMAYQFTASPASQLPLIGQFVGPIVGVFGLAITGHDPTAILGMVLAFVSTFVLLYAMIKLLLRLVNSYLTIVFLTITAPFQLLAAALPGRQGMATGWILNMLANVLVFPAVLAVFYFVAFILGQSFGPLKVANLNHQQGGNIVHTVYAAGNNQVIGTNIFPLFGGMDISFINILLAFGTLVALPSIPDIVVKSIGKMGQAGQMIGQEISGSVRSGQGYAGRIPQGASGAAQGLGTGIAGESSYFMEGGKAKRFTTKPGLWQAFRGGQSGGGGGANRTP